MSASVLPALIHAEEATRQLPMPAVMYGIVAFVVLLLLLAFLWSFRGTAYKVRDKHAAGGGHH
ncbi:MAG: hypothetical protein IPM08_04520 [Actinomycetales bacterium]|nr:hypothetical protein [Actinomycetales bacterium]